MYNGEQHRKKLYSTDAWNAGTVYWMEANELCVTKTQQGGLVGGPSTVK